MTFSLLTRKLTKEAHGNSSRKGKGRALKAHAWNTGEEQTPSTGRPVRTSPEKKREEETRKHTGLEGTSHSTLVMKQSGTCQPPRRQLVGCPSGQRLWESWSGTMLRVLQLCSAVQCHLNNSFQGAVSRWHGLRGISGGEH